MFNLKKRKLRYTDFPSFKYIQEMKDKTKWKAKSHNEEKQIEEYITYVYFKYEAPKFAVEAIKKEMKNYLELVQKKEQDKRKDSIDFCNRQILNLEKYFFTRKTGTELDLIENKDVFRTIQEGCGYYELLKGILTKKEIRYLIFDNKREKISDAVHEAKLKNIIENKEFIEYILDRYSFETFERYKEAYIYLMKHNVNKNEWTELLDYITSKIRLKGHMFIDDKIIEKKDYFKRSINKIREESDLWHIAQIKMKEQKYVSWNSTIEDLIITKANNIWTIEELCSTTALLKEGKTMKHCVGSYAKKCFNGESKIVSVKKDGESHITLEIRNNKLVQAKTKYNNSPQGVELSIINEFCQVNRFLNVA